MPVPRCADFFASGRWLGLGCSVLLHGAALAAVVSFDGVWKYGTAPELGVAIPVVWQETVAAVPEPAPAAAPESPRVPQTLKPPTTPRAPRQVRRTLAETPSPAAPAAAASDLAVESTSAPVVAREAAAPATQVADTPVEPGASSEPRPPELATAPAPPSVVGWAVVARQPPAYPAGARRRGAEGEVLLKAEISSDGAPVSITVLRSSGEPELDAAAVAAVEKWRFRAPGRFTVEIPIVFRIDDR